MNSRLRTASVALIALCGALGLAGCATTPAAPAKAVVTKPTAISFGGSVSVPGASDTGSAGEACVALSGYTDIAQAGQVVVSDSSGKTVALTTLAEGVLTQPNHMCEFDFQATKVPASSNFYGIHVGNTNRGTVQYTEAELESGPQLVIGR